jgi:hypothetical protein
MHAFRAPSVVGAFTDRLGAGHQLSLLSEPHLENAAAAAEQWADTTDAC